MQTLDIVGRKQIIRECLELPPVLIHVVNEYVDIDCIVNRITPTPNGVLLGIVDDNVFYITEEKHVYNMLHTTVHKVLMDGIDIELSLDAWNHYGVYKVNEEWIAFTSIASFDLWNRITHENIRFDDVYCAQIHNQCVYYMGRSSPSGNFGGKTKIHRKQFNCHSRWWIGTVRWAYHSG